MWLHVSQRNLILDCMEIIRHQFVIGVESPLKVPLVTCSLNALIHTDCTIKKQPVLINRYGRVHIQNGTNRQM